MYVCYLVLVGGAAGVVVGGHLREVVTYITQRKYLLYLEVVGGALREAADAVHILGLQVVCH